jgi:hypothetical protein
MLSTSFSETRMTTYVAELPLGVGWVGWVSGVKVAKGAGEAGTGVIVSTPGAGVLSGGIGEPRNNVGVAVMNGGCGVGVPGAGAQALRARSSSKTSKVFVFMFFSFGRYHSRIFWV